MNDITPTSFLIVDRLKTLVRAECAEIDESIQQVLRRQIETNRLLTALLAGLGKEVPSTESVHRAEETTTR